jgi:response regulator RpfG family c-di-GMP phosphodiesterase
MKILIIDDFDCVVEMLYDALHEDYDCICGYSANDLNKYKHEVDLIISDYGIVWVYEDGSDDFVWSIEYLKDATVPKILITGANPEDPHNNFEEDQHYVDKVFFKPINIEALKDAIEELLENR